MQQLPALIQDLGVILVTAAAVTLIFKWLKQPVVLGYLIAGLLVGPHVPFMPDILDKESIHVWAEIGVIFLLFGLGLEFSFKKLAKVGRSAGISALFEIITMTSVGYLLGQALGWTRMDSLFLGTILSMSSTTIIIRAFQELGFKAKGFVSLVFGILIVEDLAAILILVLLSMLASADAVSGTHLAFSTLRLGFFLLLWFVIGIYCIPNLLRRIKRFLSDETMLLIAIGLCLAMVMLATQVGFSPALGAFVMGSILAETREGDRIEHLMHPVRDLFAAVFFVSVGMMIDPKILADNYETIAIIIGVTIVGKLFGSGLGALLSGRNLKQSMQAGLSLAQIGEFSFLIAALGESLKVTSPFLYPIVIAVSAVTTFTTPYMIKYSEPLHDWLETKIPLAWRNKLASYEAHMANASEEGSLSMIWKNHGVMVLLNLVIVGGISLLISRLLLPFALSLVDDGRWLSIAACVLALLLCAPFLRAIIGGSELRRKNAIIFLARTAIGAVLIGSVVAQFLSIGSLPGLGLTLFATLAILIMRLSDPIYQAIEKRFLANLSEKETAGGGLKTKPLLAPWNAILTEFVISPNSELVAKSLQQSALKETIGVAVAMVERGNKRILAPDRDTVLLPYDRVSVIGTDEQLALAREKIETRDDTASADEDEAFGLESMTLRNGSPFIHKTIRECGLREDVQGLIVGIERNGSRILNPDSSLSLMPGDRLWIVGNRSRIKALRVSQHPRP